MEIDIDNKIFIEQVSQHYLIRLRKVGFSVPTSYEKDFLEDVRDDLKIILQKKIYGFSSVSEYLKSKKASQNKSNFNSKFIGNA